MREPLMIEEVTRAENHARAAAELVLGSELLPGPVPLPDFGALLARRSWWRRARVLGVIGAMGVFAFLTVSRLRETSPISYVVDGTVAISDGVIDASATTGGALASIHFSEGTEVGLAPGARLRVVGSSAHGASLALDRGRARFAVTHRPGAHWSVATGPFTIEVIGTKFTLDWSPQKERLVVDLTDGSIEVRGASVGGPVAMHPGERLIATAADRRVTLSPLVEPSASPDIQPTSVVRPSVRAVERGRYTGASAMSGRPAPGHSSSSSRRSSRRGDLAMAAPGRDWAARVQPASASASPTTTSSSPAPTSSAPVAASARPEPAAAVPAASASVLAPPPPPAVAPAGDSRPSPPARPPASGGVTLGVGGSACERDAAQYRFEKMEAGISLPDFYTLAFSSPRPDRSHSWCGQSSLRVDADFNDAGRRNFFGRFAKETGQVVIKLHRSTDFTGKTVTVHFFVDGPPDARFNAELVVVNRGRWVSGPPSGQLSTGRWLTISHTFDAENEAGVPGSSNPGPFPVGGTSPVSSCDRLGLAIHSTGGRRVWAGAVYVDDVGWK